MMRQHMLTTGVVSTHADEMRRARCWPAPAQRVLTVSPRTETDSRDRPPVRVLTVNVAGPFQVLIENGAEHTGS
jgi:hypothetical protein